MYINHEQFATVNFSENDRNGYNVAFSELGLEWYWDASTYAELQTIEGDAPRVRAYVESHHPHLLKAYDADFLVSAIQQARARTGLPQRL